MFYEVNLIGNIGIYKIKLGTYDYIGYIDYVCLPIHKVENIQDKIRLHIIS